MSIQEAIKESSTKFETYVWPVVKEQGWVEAGTSLSVEGSSDEMKKELDILAGIDLWHIVQGTGMRGIASRVSGITPGYPPFNTFTIRYSTSMGARTEFAKRKHAIENKDGGWLYPFYTIQAYIKEVKTFEGIRFQLESMALVETEELIKFASKNPSKYIRQNSWDGNRFLAIPFRDVTDKIYIRGSK